MILFLILVGGWMSQVSAGSWQEVATKTLPTKRHEAAFTELDGKFYLLGGRGIKPVEVFDPITKHWEKKSLTPIELHHFQAFSYQHEIYVVGAFTGPYPNETPVPVFYVYNPETDQWRTGETIPESRRRGAAGVVLDGDHLYLICGIVHGHQGDFVPWLDRYNFLTGEWTRLFDAPHARDHFQAVLQDGKIVAAGGR